MDSHLDVKVNERMQSSLRNFFHSLQGDGSALQSFASTLSAFQNTVRNHRNRLQVETLVAIQGFASVIDSVTSSVLELEIESEKLRREAMTDISSILGGKLSKLAIGDEQHGKPLKGKRLRDEATSHIPSYIKPSYEWLLSNLHNPYPPKHVKRDIARKSKSSLKDIDSWFIDARKRIGWNSLRKRRFSNKQEGIIAAASRFFKPPLEHLSENLLSEVDSHDEYHAEFTAMEEAARSLYSGRFAAISSSFFTRNMSLSRPASARALNKKRKRASSPPPPSTLRKSYAESSSTSSDRHQALPYPSPEPSSGLSESPSPPASEAVSLPSEDSALSRKRSRTSVEHLQRSKFGLGHNLILSHQTSTPDIWEVTDLTAAYSLPSPAPTIDSSGGSCDKNLRSEVHSSSLSPMPRVPANSYGKRKRRLSEGDGRRPAKRPHHALAVPRLHAVSDPLPISRVLVDDPFEDWFTGNFPAEPQLNGGIPSPAGLDAQNFPENLPMEIHCHNFDTSPYEPVVLLPELSFTADDNVSGTNLLPHVSEPAEALHTSSLDTLAMSNAPLDLNPTGIAGPTSFSLPLDFDFHSAVEKVSQDISFNPLDQILNLDTMAQPPAGFTWMLGDTVDLIEPPILYSMENTTSHNPAAFNSFTVSEDGDAKRLRLQFLREELQLLESELGS